MSYLFEQAGTQKQLTEAGLWYATAPEEDLIELMRQEPGLMRDWDEKYGDRMQKIVFIGQHMDKEQIIRDLDECLQQPHLSFHRRRRMFPLRKRPFPFKETRISLQGN